MSAQQLARTVEALFGELAQRRSPDELPSTELDERLRLAARVALGLEPGILLRLRALRPAELIFQGTSAGDLRISMDADQRSLPRLGAEYLLPVEPFTVPAHAWADALLRQSVEVQRPAPPDAPSPRRRRKKVSP